MPGKWNQIRWYLSAQFRTGFTLIEVLFAVSIISILAAIAIPNFINYHYKAQVASAIEEMKNIEIAISAYIIEHFELPDTLEDIGMHRVVDPWGRAYRYLRIDGGKTPGISGKQRRDKNANPVNSDYDLYSMGKDGLTQPQFTAKKARDDVVRANNGAYYGLAEKH